MTSKTLYILCGGKSRRMGQDKALLEINDQNLIEHWIQRTSPLFKEVVLLSGSALYPTSIRQLQDIIPDSGPLSGLLTAMKDSKDRGEYLAIVAIDIPNLKVSTLNLLAATVPDKSRVLIASCGNDLQPLSGIYHRKLMKDLDSYLDSGHRSVMGFIRELKPEYFDVTEDELININDPDTWRNFMIENKKKSFTSSDS